MNLLKKIWEIRNNRPLVKVGVKITGKSSLDEGEWIAEWYSEENAAADDTGRGEAENGRRGQELN